MPIDPSIPLSVKPQPFNNPFEVLAQMQHLKAQRQQIDSNQALEESRRQDIAKQARAEEVQRKFYAIIAASKDPDEAEARIQTEAPELLQPFREQRQKLDKVAAEINADKLKAKEIEASIKQKGTDYLGPVLQMVKKSGYDPKVFDFALNLAGSQFEGLPVDQLRQQGGGDPAKIAQIVAGFESPQQQNANVTAQTAAAQLPGIQADTQVKQEVAAGMQGGLTPDQQRQGAQSAATLAQQKAMAVLNASEAARHNRATEAQARASGTGDKEPLVAIMGPDGKPVLVKRSAAEGKTPATTREQGRQVTNSAALGIADLDTSLDNLDALEKEIGKTGAGSWVGAHLWNPITEATGIGAESKARQGVIDRVKQMIGKALEGGVLRKEDEIKYTKILPTIGDPPDVAKAKLIGLRELLTQKRQNSLDALKDSNYDVTKFEQRVRPAATSKPTAAELIKKYGS